MLYLLQVDICAQPFTKLVCNLLFVRRTQVAEPNLSFHNLIIAGSNAFNERGTETLMLHFV